MTEEVTQDETAGFVTSSSDFPEASPEPQEEPKAEEQANSEQSTTEGEEPEEQSGDESGDKQDESGSDAAAEPVATKKKNGVQKRIDEVIRERETERRKNEALEKRIKELEGKSEKQTDKEPVESDYDTYDEYLDALDAYDKQGDHGNTEEPGKHKADDAESDGGLTDSQKTAMAVIKEAVEGSENPSDFDEVALNPEVPITGDMLEALAECDDPAKVMYHLGKNKDIAADIAKGSPAQQMRAIAKLDLTVAKTPPKPAKTTKAPDPISPVAGSDSQQKAISEMSFSEYEAHMNKAERSKQSW